MPECASRRSPDSSPRKSRRKIAPNATRSCFDIPTPTACTSSSPPIPAKFWAVTRFSFHNPFAIGSPAPVPPEINHPPDWKTLPAPAHAAPHPFKARRPTDAARCVPPPPPFLMVSTNPVRYWAGIRIPVTEPGLPIPIRSTLLAYSDSVAGLGLFFDPRPWAFMITVGLFLSLLLWFPFVRNITKTISAMTTATEHIAEERFDIQVDATRGDELGRLGKAINHLAQRLSGFVGGQKRFLGDISHELNSPLGRMRVALAILEERVPPEHRAYVADIQEEVHFMSNLVGELLAYSKAGLKTSAVTLQPVRLDRLVRGTIQRECGENAEVAIDIPEEISVLAHPELLSRAVANVARNAMRYAGSAGLIAIEAVRVEGKIRLAVRDAGPGVPENELGKLFDPFYRIERDRSRETGGTGLGLAIVKTCVEACNGTVSAANLAPTGFEVAIVLDAAR